MNWSTTCAITTLRDALLPKLLSGEVSTFSADKIQKIE